MRTLLWAGGHLFDSTVESRRRLGLWLYGVLTPAYALAIYLLAPASEDRWPTVLGILSNNLAGWLWIAYIRERGRLYWLVPAVVVPCVCSALAYLACGPVGLGSLALIGVSVACCPVWFTVALQRSAAESAPLTDIAELAGARVLVVENSRTLREVLVTRLAAWNLRPTAVEDAHGALGALATPSREAFRIALIDASLPDMDGVTLGAEIHRDRRWSKLELVLITQAFPPDAQRLSDAGFVGYLSKPVRESQLRGYLAATADVRATYAKRSSLSLRPSVQGNVLIAEDNRTSQQVALAILRNLGLSGEVVDNGILALEALHRKHYDLVLMDLQMPELGGVEAARAIRADPELAKRRVPIIGVTARVMKGDREACLDAGMDDYIAKPLTPATLMRAIERWLSVEEQPSNALRTRAEPASQALTFDEEAFLDRLMGDRELGQIVVEGFVQDMQLQLDDLCAAIAKSDGRAVQHRAHSIKGAAAAVSGLRLADLAGELEALAERDELADALARYEVMAQEFEQLRAKVDRSGWVRCIGASA